MRGGSPHAPSRPVDYESGIYPLLVYGKDEAASLSPANANSCGGFARPDQSAAGASPSNSSATPHAKSGRTLPPCSTSSFALCGAGTVSIREAARRVGRNVKAVHGDVTALLNAGILERAEAGGIVFPFEAVQVEFTLRAA